MVFTHPRLVEAEVVEVFHEVDVPAQLQRGIDVQRVVGRKEGAELDRIRGPHGRALLGVSGAQQGRERVRHHIDAGFRSTTELDQVIQKIPAERAARSEAPIAGRGCGEALGSQESVEAADNELDEILVEGGHALGRRVPVVAVPLVNAPQSLQEAGDRDGPAQLQPVRIGIRIRSANLAQQGGIHVLARRTQRGMILRRQLRNDLHPPKTPNSVLHKQFEVRIGQCTHQCVRVRGLRGGSEGRDIGCDPVTYGPAEVEENRREQVVLGSEVIVHRGRSEPGRRVDGAHRHRIHSLGGEKSLGHLDQLRAGCRALSISGGGGHGQSMSQLDGHPGDGFQWPRMARDRPTRAGSELAPRPPAGLATPIRRDDRLAASKGWNGARVSARSVWWAGAGPRSSPIGR
ncbi:hypothetical protein RHCRD62_60319 [Rhodococcus sp. RD6.2]|nr:hypothetical protein RHCRD62_60319 [Rhodococcus sp. RD6.2]